MNKTTRINRGRWSHLEVEARDAATLGLIASALVNASATSEFAQGAIRAIIEAGNELRCGTEVVSKSCSKGSFRIHRGRRLSIIDAAWIKANGELRQIHLKVTNASYAAAETILENSNIVSDFIEVTDKPARKAKAATVK